MGTVGPLFLLTGVAGIDRSYSAPPPKKPKEPNNILALFLIATVVLLISLLIAIAV